MPTIAVKPDGTQILAAWYDRRRDTNNSFIDVYARWGNVLADGNINFPSNDFRITTTSFPPVYAGNLAQNQEEGYYDPVYPGETNGYGPNLHWWYPEWPSLEEDQFALAVGTYKNHVGEYNGACADGNYAYVTWTDNRMRSSSSYFGRNQSDIRLLKLHWPQ